MSISKILQEPTLGSVITVKGWVRSFRSNRFIALNDGSALANLQCVVDFENEDENQLKRITTGACLAVTGELVESQGKGQSVEINVQSFEVLGDAPVEEYPLQPKKHSLEFLREIAHLRPRTNTFGAVFRIRHALSFAIHNYFNKEGFFNWHSPIITGSDAEGAGEMFRVTTLPNGTDQESSEDFFGKETHLTVSGQLEGELGAMGLGKIYTFGPTFRAENSNTTRHLAEFWMIEPEMAFCTLEDDMRCAEDYVRFCCKHLLETCKPDLDFIAKMIDPSCIERLEQVSNTPFVRLTYTDAVSKLEEAVSNGKKFDFPVSWGIDLASEHERYLTEEVYKQPVIVYNYPKDIKAFYMKLNDDGKTVAAMDVLVPGVGELIGGSQREDDLEALEKRIVEIGQDLAAYSSYLDMRRYGNVPHSGFGLGFERLILFATGIDNIRDIIPFPRWPGNCSH